MMHSKSTLAKLSERSGKMRLWFTAVMIGQRTRTIPEGSEMLLMHMQVASVDVVQDSFQSFLAGTEQRFDIVVSCLRTPDALVH